MVPPAFLPVLYGCKREAGAARGLQGSARELCLYAYADVSRLQEAWVPTTPHTQVYIMTTSSPSHEHLLYRLIHVAHVAARPKSFTQHDAHRGARRSSCRAAPHVHALQPQAPCFLSCSRSSFSLRRACSAAPSCSRAAPLWWSRAPRSLVRGRPWPHPCPSQTNDWSMSWMY